MSTGSALSLKQPFISSEITAYKKIFSELDNEQLSIITGDKLKPLFVNSKVPNDKLAIIWELADFDNKGFLTFDQFAICCRLIGFLQFNNNNLPRNLTVEDYQVYYKLADFSGTFQPQPQQQLNRQSSFMLNRQASTSSLQSGSSTGQIPPPTIAEISQFSQLFDTYSNGKTTISGESARGIFQKSNLPTQTLVEIWAFADQNDVGYLDKPQFVVAMYLVQLSMNKKISSPLPNHLPNSVWSVVRQQTGATNSPMGQISNQNTGTFQPPMHPQSPLQRNLTSNSMDTPVANWTLTSEKCKSFDAIFDSLDKTHSGKLGTDILVPYFLESGLSQDVLAVIWDLADVQNNAAFSSVEFSIAMFLIQKTNAGVELPDIVPQSLLQSSIENHQNKYASANFASIPHRETKPSYDSNNSSKSPLNDLLTLDNNSFSAHQQQLASVSESSNHQGNMFSQPTTIQNTVNNNITPVKKFKPSSSFGQSIIPEEPPQIHDAPSASSPTAGVVGNISSPLRYNYTSSLPTVPNFATLASPTTSRQASTNNPASSMALSNATTEVANLSTQVRSLSNQTKLVQDRKARAEQELAKITATKVTIENRLASLRQVFTTETALAEQAEQQHAELQKESASLQQELQVLDSNYQSLKSQHDNTNNSLNALLEQNNVLKQNIVAMNNQSEILAKDLEIKKQELSKHEGLVSVNNKQLEMSEVNSDNLQKEIALIGQHFETFISKKSELDQYSQSLSQQHQLMNDKHKELEDGFQSLQTRQQDLESKTAGIEQQEQIYNENVQRLQELFNDFQQQQQRLEDERAILEENEAKLENDRNHYLNRVQDFATQDFDLPPQSEVPVNHSAISEKQISNGKSVSVPQSNDVANHLTSDLPEITQTDEEKKIYETTAMDDVPTHESTTSSVLNHASQSSILPKLESISENFKDPVDKGIPGGFEENDYTNKSTADLQSTNLVGAQLDEIPNTPPPTNKDDLAKQIREENASFNSSIQSSPKLDIALSDTKEEQKALVGLPISGPTGQEFPPIKELEISESDSSDDEDDEVPTGAHPISTALPATKSADFSEFDEFDGLEAAQIIEDDEGEDENEYDASEDEFHDTNENTAFSKNSASNKSPPAWDELFESLDKAPQEHKTQVVTQQIQPSSNIAISPKDLAIEELTDMGFSEHESKEALERFNWHLESAAQYLVNKN